jgi:hypothetical protein
MIYLPWIAFLLGILWMIRQGSKSKEEYLRQRKAAERDKSRAVTEENVAKALKQDHGQSRLPDLAETLGGKGGQTEGSAYGSGSGLVSWSHGLGGTQRPEPKGAGFLS